MRLNQLSDNPGARKPAKRVGRGIGSGMGKTSTKGQKGQKSRSGVAINGFEGGQMPIYRRLPKRGFNPLNKVNYAIVNVGSLQKAVDGGRIEAGSDVTRDTLVAAGLVRKNGAPVRLLGKGEIKAKLSIEVAGASASAIKAVEAAGGSVTVSQAKPAPAAQSEVEA